MSKEIKNTIDKIQKEVKQTLKEIKSLDSLEELRVQALGRKSELVSVLKQLKDLAEDEKKKIGPVANKVRGDIFQIIGEKKKELEKEMNLDKEWMDVTLPGWKQRVGHRHIISQVQIEIEEIFRSMGFEIADGPEVEDEWHNFTALNVPADHPARDMQDTFWLRQNADNSEQTTDNKKNSKLKLLPRTQTSNMQIRHMENNEPPLRIIVPGRTFRNEATDAVHEHTFNQFEALVVDKEISVANFKYIAKTFFSAFFEMDVDVRLRPSYFPFTEPSFEFDISCTVCGGEGCKSCKQSGWLEVGGCGMVNQNVFENCGYERNKWQGFAWGFGLERLAMMKYKIDDIRLFMSGDLRFIKQF